MHVAQVQKIRSDKLGSEVTIFFAQTKINVKFTWFTALHLKLKVASPQGDPSAAASQVISDHTADTG